jgi:PAS domain S-box-containing protein
VGAVAVAGIPALAVSLVLGGQLARVRQADLRDRLHESAVLVSRRIDAFLGEHQRALQLLANSLDDPSAGTNGEAQASPLLAEWRVAYPNILTLAVMDASGTLRSVDSGPDGGIDPMAVAGAALMARAVAGTNLEGHVVTTGGDDPLAIVTAPVAGDGGLNGIVVAALRVASIGFEDGYDAAGDASILITDGQERVLFARSREGVSGVGGAGRTESLDGSGMPGADDEVLIGTASPLSVDWRVVVHQPVRTITALATRAYATTLGLVGVAVALAVLIAARFARSITNPLSGLIAMLDRFNTVDATPGPTALPAGAPNEIVHLTERFHDLVGRLRQSYTALKESEQRLRTVVDRAPEAIVIVDAKHGKIVDASEEATKLFGRTREQLFEVDLPSLAPPTQPDGRDSREAVARFVRDTIRGRPGVAEFLLQNANGDRIPCEIRAVRLPASGRTLVRASILDVSARKQAEEAREKLESQLVRAQRLEAVGHLTGGIAHDFNNLLTVITGNLDLLQFELDDRPDLQANALDALNAARKGAGLTHQLLAYSRKQALKPQALDLGSLVQDLQSMLQRTLGETVRVASQRDDNLWFCRVDPGQLEHTILNLAINARDAMPRGGTLTLTARNGVLDRHAGIVHQWGAQPGQYVILEVRDTGTGMSPEVMSQVFDPFFTTKEIGKGSGLGLSMVYGFIKQSGGYIAAESEIGKGTLITVYFPRDTSKPVDDNETVQPSAEEPKGAGETVLIVEDESSVRELTVILARQLGYDPVEAEHVAGAITILETHPNVRIVVSDIVLPGGRSGVDLAQFALRRWPELRFILMSGYPADTLNRRINGRELDLMKKPFNRSTLAHRLHRVLQAS